MARKKKKKIVVELDFPKDDTTMTKLYSILAVSLFIGFSCMTFWLTNSHFTTSPNHSPMFVNLYCGYNPNVVPTFAQNESCDILKDSPDTLIWEPEEWKAIGTRGQGQLFDVPGVDPTTSGGLYLPQPLVATCEVKADVPVDYTFSIHKPDHSVMKAYNGNSGLATDNCFIEINNMNPDEKYSVVVITNDGGKLKEVSFVIQVDYYDGVPQYMNNASIWIGPEVEFIGFVIHPVIFLNFFGFGLFFIFWPASYYWDRVKYNINAMEEKFPDFLRDMAEYWKGGLSMTIAVQTLAGSEYGVLNDEVKKMSDQLSWGIAFGDVIQMFAVRVGTPLVQRAISLISEANRAGGKISDILVTAANDSREIKFLEGERRRTIASYISVIWTSYFVFLGVIVVLAKVFIPAISGSNSSSSGEEGDAGGEAIGNMVIRNIDPLFFLTVFFYGVVMQAMGNGAMAGLMATGRWSSGFKHSGLMIIVAMLCFNFIAFTPDLIGVSALPGLNPSVGTFTP
jgi:flagellar protein FlaJ